MKIFLVSLMLFASCATSQLVGMETADNHEPFLVEPANLKKISQTTAEQFNELVRRAPNLEEIDIGINDNILAAIDELPDGAFEHLRIIDLGGTNTIAANFNELVRRAPNLEELDLGDYENLEDLLLEDLLEGLLFIAIKDCGSKAS